jgi:hypothetical protein
MPATVVMMPLLFQKTLASCSSVRKLPVKVPVKVVPELRKIVAELKQIVFASA